jgi:hypothetical protein
MSEAQTWLLGFPGVRGIYIGLARRAFSNGNASALEK